MIEGALISLPVVSRKGIFFWLFRCLVRVRYTFFLATALLGLRSRSITGIAAWLVAVFAAVLLHEFGHAFAARAFRQKPRIELHALGGETTWAWTNGLTWFQRVYIALAGPAAGFAVGGLLWLAGRFIPPGEPHVVSLVRHNFLWATLAWGAFNLVPMFPLDGGQVFAEVVEHRFGRDRGRLLARQVSIGAGLVGLAAGILLDEAWLGLLCGVLAFDNYQRLRGLPGFALPR